MPTGSTVREFTVLPVGIHLPGPVGRIDTHSDVHREQCVSMQETPQLQRCSPPGAPHNWHLHSGAEVWITGAAVWRSETSAAGLPIWGVEV